MSKLVELARQMRAAMDRAGTMLTDAQASTVTAIYPRLKDSGELVPVGTRIQWNGTIRRSRVDLWDAKENNPDNAPELWETVMYREGIRVIPEVIVAENPFSLGEQGWWGGVLYESLMNANVYTPDAYPAGWKAVENGE